jgi:hypothetical protein
MYAQQPTSATAAGPKPAETVRTGMATSPAPTALADTSATAPSHRPDDGSFRVAALFESPALKMRWNDSSGICATPPTRREAWASADRRARVFEHRRFQCMRDVNDISTTV